MEQTTQTAVDSVESGKNYNAHNREDKFYFGGYFNLAQNNITTSLLEIKKRLNIEFDDTEKLNTKNLAEFFDRFKDKLESQSDRNKFLNLVTEYFPVMDLLAFEPMNPKDEIEEKEHIKKKIVNFRLLIKAVTTLRDYYSHSPDQQVKLNDLTAPLLDHILFKTVLFVKKDRMKADKTKLVFSKKLNEELFALMPAAKIEIKKGDKSDENVKALILNRAFSHFLFKENINAKKKADAKTNYYTKDNEQLHALSDAGVVLILSFFLTTKEYEAFRGNIIGFKGTSLAPNETPKLEKNSFHYMATHWVYTFNNFRGLKHPVKTAFEKETLLMQLLDYLSKVPDEIYSHLSKDQQKRYITDLNEFMTSYDEVELNEQQEEAINSTTILRPVIRKRYEDFFNYFALRFLDEFAEFPSLRFKINVGTYVHDVRSKPLGKKNEQTNRVLKENIFVFDQLSKVNRKKAQLTHTDALNAVGWDQFPNPHYAITNNTISIAFTNTEKQLLKSSREQEKRTSGKASQNDILEKLYGKEKFHLQTHAILSLNELPALLYELLVKKTSSAEIEKTLLEKTEALKHNPELAKTKKGKTIGKGLLKAKLTRDIEIECQKTALKQALILQNVKKQEEDSKKKNNTPKKRKYVFYIKEKGIEALWIANDLLRLMPARAKSNWKGYLHNELQRLLAVYAQNTKQAVKDLFRGYWELENDQFAGIKFLKCLDKGKFEDFYKSYLELRKEVLTGLRSIASKYDPQDETHLELWRFFDKKLYYNNYTSLEDLKGAVEHQPCLLPRGIFDKKGTVVPGKNPDVQADQAEFADWYIFARNPKHSFQAFYKEDIAWDQAYETYLQNKTVVKSASVISSLDLPKQPDTKDPIGRFIQRSQHAITKQQHKDVFMWEMVAFLAKKLHFSETAHFTLADTYISQEERKLRLQHAEAQSKREKETIAPNLRAEHTFWEQVIHKTCCDGRIEVGECKLKNAGKYNRYEWDNRVAQLLHYIPQEEKPIWTAAEIERELYDGPESYESLRAHEVLKTMFDFERSILYNTQPPPQFDNKKYPNFRKDLHKRIASRLTDAENQLLAQKDFESLQAASVKEVSLLVQKSCLLIQCRNKLLHNQYPAKSWFELAQLFLAKQPAETFARYYCRLIQYLCEEVTREVG